MKSAVCAVQGGNSTFTCGGEDSREHLCEWSAVEEMDPSVCSKEIKHRFVMAGEWYGLENFYRL